MPIPCCLCHKYGLYASNLHATVGGIWAKLKSSLTARDNDNKNKNDNDNNNNAKQQQEQLQQEPHVAKYFN